MVQNPAARLSWLHISDIHFYPENEWRDSSARKALLRYLEDCFSRQELPKPDLIFCTGDIAFGETRAASMRKQYTAAREFFDRLRVICGTEGAPLPIERLYVVPGNHDVNRKRIDPEFQQRLVTCAKQASYYEGEVNKSLARGDKAYKQALKRLDEYGAFIKAYLPHQVDPKGRHIYGCTLPINGIEVGIAGFNSAWSCAGDEDDRRLWLAGYYQFDRAREALESAYVRIGLIHHPIDWLNPADHEIARRRIPADFDFWLHGHTHSAWVEPHQSHVAISAGAVGAEVQDEFGINLVSLDMASGNGNVHLHSFSTKSREWAIYPIPGFAPRGIWLLDLKERLKLASASREASTDDILSQSLSRGLMLAFGALAGWTTHHALQTLGVKVRTYFARRSALNDVETAIADALVQERGSFETDWTADGVDQVVQALERACREPAAAQILGALIVEHMKVGGGDLSDMLGGRIDAEDNLQPLLSDACRDRAALLLSSLRARVTGAEGIQDAFALAAHLTTMNQLSGFSRKIASSLDRIAVQRAYLQDEAAERDLDEKQTTELGNYLAYLRDHELALSKLPLTSAAALERPPPRLKDLYVPLQVRETSRHKHTPRRRPRGESRSTDDKASANAEPQETEIGGILAAHRRVVLLAPVGSGKTTLLSYAALAFADARPGDVAGWPGGSLVPIFIRLRSFAGFLKEQSDFNSAALNAIIAYLSHHYSNSQGLDLSANFFVDLLSAGGCGVFFDGLDEVPLAQRADVAEHVSDFIRFFSKALPVDHAQRENVFLLSSRPKGFEPVEAILAKAAPVRRELKPLDPRGVRSLIRRILEYLEPDHNTLNQDFSILSRAIENREDLAEIASTPLFCTSLVQVYKIHGADLPARRVDVLEEIVVLLLGFWKAQDDRSSRRDEDDVDGGLKLETRVEYKRRRLAHVALQMQLSGKRAEIDFPTLVDTLVAFLRDREGVEEAKGPQLAERFVDESHERSGLLIETDPSAPRIFAFSHEGFREFLVGEAMRNQGEEELSRLALDHIDDPTWEEVIVLLAANRALSDKAREDLLEKCVAAADQRFTAENIESWARHLTVTGRMVRDMGDYLPRHIKGRYQLKLLTEIARSDGQLAHRSGIALGLDEIGWRASGTFAFGTPHTLGNNHFQLALHPVTNGQYRRFMEASDFSDFDLWAQPTALTTSGRLRTLSSEFQSWWFANGNYDKRIPKSWHDPKFGIAHSGLPVVGISWFEAVAYCRWLERHWNELDEGQGEQAPSPIRVRLPYEREWDIATAYAVGGEVRFGRANIDKAIDQTLPVGMLEADSIGVVQEAVGNVWEWQAGYVDLSFRGIALRGGSFATAIDVLGRDLRGWTPANNRENDVGFRVLIELREQ